MFIRILLTVNESMEEKNVPSSYLESLLSTDSKTDSNCRKYKHTVIENRKTILI